MYGYNERMLTKDEILKSIPQELIVEKLITGVPVVPYERVLSVFKSDKKPNCYFEWFGGKLWFIDHADNTTHRDVFNMVQDFHNTDFFGALKLISDTFSGVEVVDLPEPAQKYVKKFHEITFKSRQFSERDRAYWSPYGVKRQELMDDGVFAVVWYRFFSIKLERYIIVRPDDICYAYTEFPGKAKVYRPYGKSTGKWISNCTSDEVGNIKNITGSGDTLLINKSYKDCRVVRNVDFKETVWFQNEGMKPQDEYLKQLCEGYRRIVIWYDNDRRGVESSERLVAYLKLLLPNKIIGSITIPGNSIKDPAQLRKEKGQEALANFLYSNLNNL